jgi:hypothetical protein
MHGQTALLALLALAARALGSSEVSCAGDACAAEAGVALLQNRHGSMKINRVSGVTQDRMGTCVEIARGAQFTQTGYELVKAGCCFDGMSEYIHRVAEIEMEFTVCGLGFAPGLAKWHTCTGKGADATFQDLKDSITANAATRCSALRKKPETCTNPPRPDNCPKRGDVANPPSCGCSRSKSINLDFSKAKIVKNNLNDQGPNRNDPDHQIKYQGIGKNSDGKLLDLKVTSGGVYQTSKSGQNGVYGREGGSNKFGYISMNRNIKADLTFTFLESGVVLEDGSDKEAEVKDLVFTVYDLDGFPSIKKQNGEIKKPSRFEGVRCSSFAGFVAEDDTYLTVSRFTDGVTRFANENEHEVCNDDTCKWDDPMNLTPDQRRGSVMFFFKNVSSFDLSYVINPELSENRDTSGTDALMFSGKSSLIDKCGP